MVSICNPRYTWHRSCQEGSVNVFRICPARLIRQRCTPYLMVSVRAVPARIGIRVHQRIRAESSGANSESVYICPLDKATVMW